VNIVLMRKSLAIILGAGVLIFSNATIAQNNYWDPRPIPQDKQKKPDEITPTRKITAAPKMPSNARRSGFCCMVYDVNAEGLPENVATSFCNKSKFRKPSIKAIQKWRFNPAIANGLNVRANNQSRIMTFQLTDQNGLIIPDRNHLLVLNGRYDASKERLCNAFESS